MTASDAGDTTISGERPAIRSRREFIGQRNGPQSETHLVPGAHIPRADRASASPFAPQGLNHHVLLEARREECVHPPIVHRRPAKRPTETSKDSKENGSASRSVTPIPSRSVTPKPPDGAENNFRSGTLTIRIFSGEYEGWFTWTNASSRGSGLTTCLVQVAALPSPQASQCPM